ncbi:Oxaloacetate decarboxylase, partial [Geodia barretti]
GFHDAPGEIPGDSGGGQVRAPRVGVRPHLGPHCRGPGIRGGHVRRVHRLLHRAGSARHRGADPDRVRPADPPHLPRRRPVVMVDADHGYGNALSVMRTVEELETAGVSALTIEDTVLPVSFGANGAQLLSVEEGIGKMKAALAGRTDPALTIAGRTSALRISGLEDTIKRVKAYEAAGVDAIFLAGANTRDEVAAVAAEVSVPLLLGGTTGELQDKEWLGANGVKVALQGHLPFSAAVKAVYDTLKALRDGVAPADLRDSLAPDEMMGQFTRRSSYQKWTADYLN